MGEQTRPGAAHHAVVMPPRAFAAARPRMRSPRPSAPERSAGGTAPPGHPGEIIEPVPGRPRDDGIRQPPAVGPRALEPLERSPRTRWGGHLKAIRTNSHPGSPRTRWSGLWDVRDHAEAGGVPHRSSGYATPLVGLRRAARRIAPRRPSRRSAGAGLATARRAAESLRCGRRGLWGFLH